jgi:hypothetical protein
MAMPHSGEERARKILTTFLVDIVAFEKRYESVPRRHFTHLCLVECVFSLQENSAMDLASHSVNPFSQRTLVPIS